MGLTIVAPILVANSVSTPLILRVLGSFYPIHRDECARLPPCPSISFDNDQLKAILFIQGAEEDPPQK